jgi:hypothetical protein
MQARMTPQFKLVKTIGYIQDQITLFKTTLRHVKSPKNSFKKILEFFFHFKFKMLDILPWFSLWALTLMMTSYFCPSKP